MSWYRDPQLFFTLGTDSNIYVRRITKPVDINPVRTSDYLAPELLEFNKHLALANNKFSDYLAYKATFAIPTNLYKLVNSQGYVVYFDVSTATGIWSREETGSPFWSLPGVGKPPKSEQALEKKVSDLEEKISYLEEERKRINKEKEAIETENANLKAQANRQRGDEIVAGLEALRKQVLDLTLKPVQCCGGGVRVGSSVEEPWTTGHTVPSNWVPFRDLDVEPFTKNIPLLITKAAGGLKFGDDNTTNVRASHFYGGIFPIVVVHIAELTPDREEARFDPDVWSRYVNAGIEYAARKPFPSEMSVDAHKMC